MLSGQNVKKVNMHDTVSHFTHSLVKDRVPSENYDSKVGIFLFVFGSKVKSKSRWQTIITATIKIMTIYGLVQRASHTISVTIAQYFGRTMP